MVQEFKIMKNDIEETYIYNYEKMSMWQVLNAAANFEYSEKMKDVIVQSKDEKARLMQKTIGIDGYELLLMKVNDKKIMLNTSKVQYTTGISDYLTGADITLLEECKQDFFQKRGIISHQSKELMRDLIKLIPEGSSISEIMEKVMQTATNFTTK